MKHAIEHIERPGCLFSQFYPENPIRKSRLDLRIMAESKGQRRLAKATSTTQRGGNRRCLIFLSVEQQMLDGIKGFGTSDIALGQVAGLKEATTRLELLFFFRSIRDKGRWHFFGRGRQRKIWRGKVFLQSRFPLKCIEGVVHERQKFYG